MITGMPWSETMRQTLQRKRADARAKLGPIIAVVE